MEPSVVVLLTMMASGTLILVAGFLFLLSTHLIWTRRRHSALQTALRGTHSPSPGEPPDMGLERPATWLAFRSEDPLRVAAALGLEGLMPNESPRPSWDLAPNEWFISPALNGWVLCWGPKLADPGDNIDRLHRLLMDLSAHFTGLQYYHQNQILGTHAWVRVENQQVYRAYAWAEGTQWNEGDFTAAERLLGLQCQPYGHTDPAWPSPDHPRANTLRVPMLAAQWSLDPLFYLRLGSAPGAGFVGVASRRETF